MSGDRPSNGARIACHIGSELRKGHPISSAQPYGSGVNNPGPYSSDILWACVEEGFHVGSRGGDFLGYVDRQAGGEYIAFDARSRSLGSFPTLEDATAAVSRSSSDPAPVDRTDAGVKGAVQR